ncbi:uncharacterized protein N7498_005925 [Penicillium cinerascens]|uniref:MOSC domain-containing protein n=1 Tax=Penicillium cinerascens TaxID=70096 RepID=A0A9W9MPC9_9EURO|nr:uncharacterized protein N7498_005925 [Penicillium cinerascens]KAJ5205046.1 hypothetical protein N7498_005925 [Penicillium cinerascens]
MHTVSEELIIAELEQPWQRDQLDEVRTGKGKPVFGLPLQSAIFKSVRYGSVTVDKLGCQGDEHAYEFHGGPDKALLQYCSRHYNVWGKELRGSEHLFRVGGFGENLVARNANERNTCIGDVDRIGRDVIVQVSMPRQPCYKLNHRFQEKNISRLTQEKFRTGWFYRILHEGSIHAGDDIELLERPHPEWTVALVQHYLYIEKENYEIMKELAEIEELGNEIRDIFQNRLNKKFEDQEARLLGDDSMALDMWADYRLAQKRKETPAVESFVFEAVHPRMSPEEALPGTHVRLKLGGRLIRAYSVVGGNQNRFTLGVALDRDASRGGSLYLHQTIREGEVITISNFVATFPLAKEADHHTLIAGGIGITGLLASALELERSNASYHLHYVNAADELGLPKQNIHFESFQANSTGDPFTAELAETKKEVDVGPGESLLDALRSAGFDIPSTCEAGNCGTCRVGVRSGRVEHRGTGLLDNEKDTAMLSCVSRGIGRIVLDL